MLILSLYCIMIIHTSGSRAGTREEQGCSQGWDSVE
jgi:hypothetical protein